MLSHLLASAFHLLTLALLLGPLRLRFWALGSGLLALATHLLVLWQNQLDFRLLQAVSWVGFGMAVLAAPGLLKARWRVLTAVAAALAALSVLLPLLSPQGPGSGPRNWQIDLHIALALAAYAALSLATVQALLVRHQEQALRRHQPPLWGRIALPPLSTTEQQLFRWIQVGFVLLSLTLLSGILFIRDWFTQHLVHKTVLTLFAWVVFGVLLLGHLTQGWRGRQAARWTLAGMILLLLAFFGSKFVLEVVLQRG